MRVCQHWMGCAKKRDCAPYKTYPFQPLSFLCSITAYPNAQKDQSRDIHTGDEKPDQPCSNRRCQAVYERDRAHCGLPCFCSCPFGLVIEDAVDDTDRI